MITRFRSILKAAAVAARALLRAARSAAPFPADTVPVWTEIV